MRISDWSSDVCSSDLGPLSAWRKAASSRVQRHVTLKRPSRGRRYPPDSPAWTEPAKGAPMSDDIYDDDDGHEAAPMEMLASDRKSTRLNSKSLMRTSYAVFGLKKKKDNNK